MSGGQIFIPRSGRAASDSELGSKHIVVEEKGVERPRESPSRPRHRWSPS